MSLTSMKLSKRKAKREIAIDDSGPRFPHGLTLHLNEDVLEKLGIDSLPEIGSEMIVVGVGVVESASQHKRQGSDDRSVNIQLTDIDVGPKEADESVEAAVDAAIKEA